MIVSVQGGPVRQLHSLGLTMDALLFPPFAPPYTHHRNQAELCCPATISDVLATSTSPIELAADAGRPPWSCFHGFQQPGNPLCGHGWVFLVMSWSCWPISCFVRACGWLTPKPSLLQLGTTRRHRPYRLCILQPPRI